MDARLRVMDAGSNGDGRSFIRLAGLAAVAAGVATLAYSAAFIGLVLTGAAPPIGQLLSSVALLIGSTLTVVAFAGLYRHVLNGDAGFALLALLLGAVGGIGGTIHGGYDLAVALHPPSGELGAVVDLPNPINPRGLLSFGVAGLGVIAAGQVITRRGLLSRGLARWSYVTGALMVATYLGRLLIVTPTDPLVAVPAAITGFVAVPTWLVWLGIELRRASGSTADA